MTNQRRTYPWDKWLARKREFTLTQGVDFDVAPRSMGQQFRTRCYMINKTVSLKVIGNTLKVRVNHDA